MVPGGTGDLVALHVVGEYSVDKADSQAWTIGQKVYFDDSAKVFTTAATSGNAAAGVAVEAVAATAGLKTGKIRLNGSFV